MIQQRVVLHVGTPKSGTTYLQELLWSSRASLAEVGVLVPGASMADHFHAAVELGLGGFHGWRDPAVTGAWMRLVEAARAHAGTTVLSHEMFGDLSAEVTARALADLDFAEVHVVATARDLARQLPAVWQEDLKNRFHLPFPELLELVRPGSGRPDVMRPTGQGLEGHAAAFWMRQDVPSVLERWGAGLPRTQVHLVTLPPSGGGTALLWQRFAEVLGVDPALATPPAARRNASMGQAECEMLRLLNERLDHGLPWPSYGPQITHHLALTALAQRPGTAPVVLPGSARGWVAAASDAQIAALAELGCTITGDLEDLRVSPADPTGPPRTSSPEEVLGAALDAIIGLLHAGPPAAPPVPVEPSSDVPAAVTAAAAAPGVPAPRVSDEELSESTVDRPEVSAPPAAPPGTPHPLSRLTRALRRFATARVTTPPVGAVPLDDVLSAADADRLVGA